MPQATVEWGRAVNPAMIRVTNYAQNDVFNTVFEY